MNDMLTTFLYAALAIGVFAIACWGAFWICARADAPKAAKWVVGGLLLIVLLYTLVRIVNANTSGADTNLHLPQSR